jgi:small-conductance mechanosensitive channel
MESELEVRCKIAEARLGVAEKLRIPMASLAGLLAFSYLNSWFIAVVVIIAVMLVVPYWYTKEYDKAWDEYERATGTGKYYKPKETNDA